LVGVYALWVTKKEITEFNLNYQKRQFNYIPMVFEEKQEIKLSVAL
jgi:hypothetical protein